MAVWVQVIFWVFTILFLWGIADAIQAVGRQLGEAIAGQKKTNELLEAMAVRVQRMELLIYQRTKLPYRPEDDPTF